VVAKLSSWLLVIGKRCAVYGSKKGVKEALKEAD
jgi:hypothetical protein